MHNREYDEQKQAAMSAAPTAKEFLESKGYTFSANPDINDSQSTVEEIATLLDEYHAIASGNKINVDRKFDNVIDRDYKGEPLKPIE